MDDSAEINGGFRRLWYSLLFFALLFLISCSPETVLVVGDPYIKLISGNTWGPLSLPFKIRARFAGYRVISELTDNQTDLSAIFNAFETVPDYLIVSPWNASSINRLPESESRIVVAGGYSQESYGLAVHSIVPDRLNAMAGFGILASDIAAETGKPALGLFNAVTDRQKMELSMLAETFGDSDMLQIFDFADTENKELPADFEKQVADASVLLLFAGPMNITALGASDPAYIPVITESLGGSTAWNDRIVVSVEDDFGELNKAIIQKLGSDFVEDVSYYPAQVRKGVLYSSQDR